MTIVVGLPFGKDGSAAIELAGMLARAAQESVRAVTVVPAPWPTPAAEGVDRAMEVWSAEQGEATVEAAKLLLEEHCADVPHEAAWVTGRSTPSRLIEEARRLDARGIVVGSGDDGAYGQVHPGSVGDRLLHSSPVPVAIAGRGFHVSAGARVSRATCAFRGDKESRRTLERTARICATANCSLRVVTLAVRGRTMFPPEVGTRAEDDVLERWREQAERAQQQAVAALRSSGEFTGPVETAVAAARSWQGAFDQVSWERDEVLVVGSSASSRMGRIFVGSSGAKLIRHSPVPVVVVP